MVIPILEYPEVNNFVNNEECFFLTKLIYFMQYWKYSKLLPSLYQLQESQNLCLYNQFITADQICVKWLLLLGAYRVVFILCFTANE